MFESQSFLTQSFLATLLKLQFTRLTIGSFKLDLRYQISFYHNHFVIQRNSLRAYLFQILFLHLLQFVFYFKLRNFKASLKVGEADGALFLN